jgi:hypothetical protein
LNGVSFKGEETFGMKRARKDNRNSTIIRLWIFGLGSIRSEWRIYNTTALSGRSFGFLIDAGAGV